MGEQVGYVNAWSHPSRPGAAGIYSNFIGGVPRTASPLAYPLCGGCGSPLFLVLQLYAPTDRERFLYIFGCNKHACADAPDAFVALRTLGGVVAVVEEEEEATAAPDDAMAAAVTDEWGSGGGGGGWGAASEWEAAADAIGGAASVALLAATTAALSISSSATTVAPVPAPVPAPARQIKQTRGRDALPPTPAAPPAFPCFIVETAYGKGESFGGGAASESESDSDDEAVCVSSTTAPSSHFTSISRSSSSRATADWAYAQRLLEAYNAREAIESECGGGGGGDGVGGEAAFAAAEEAADNNNTKNGAAGASAEEEEEVADERGGVSGGSGSGGGGERYEKTPAKLRYLLRFQRRVARFPTQVLRYVWDAPGDVLWPVPPAARPRAPPPCKCGAPRRLEVQIMPTVLFGLGVDDTNEPGGGMDFLSLLVYACEAACQWANSEVVIALSPK